MLQLHRMFGLLTWFFTPIKLYDGDGTNSGASAEAMTQGGFGEFGSGVKGPDGIEMSYGELAAQNAAEDAEFNTDPWGEKGTTDVFGDPGTLSQALGDDSTGWGAGQIESDPLAFDLSHLDTPNMELRSSVEFSLGTPISSIIDSGEKTNFGASSQSKTLATTGLSGFLNSTFGLELDAHLNLKGEEVGPLDEAVLDVVDTFYSDTVGITVGGTQAVSDVTTLALMGAMGVSGVGLAAATVTASASIALSEGLISEHEYAQVKAVSAAVNLTIAVVNLPSQIEALKSMSGYMTTGEKILAYAVTLSMLGLQVKEFVDAMDIAGIEFGSVSYDDAMSFFNSNSNDGNGNADTYKLKNYSSATNIYNAFAKWKATTNNSKVSVDNVLDDPDRFLAGNALYNVQFAGSELYLYDNPRQSGNIDNRTLGINHAGKIALKQEDAHYEDLQPVKMITGGNTSNLYTIKRGQITQLKDLIDSHTALEDSYNSAVDSSNTLIVNYNNMLGNTQSAISGYNSSVAQFDADIDSYNRLMHDTTLTRSEIDSLVAEHDAKVASFNSRESGLNSQKSHIDSMQSTLNTMESNIESSKNRLASMRTNLDRSLANIEDVRGQFNL